MRQPVTFPSPALRGRMGLNPLGDCPMIRCPDRLALWLWTRPFHRLPDPLWFLIASPLLNFASSPRGAWFAWPKRPRQ